VNYAMHLDTIGGTLISADYPYFLGRLLGRVRDPDMLTIFTAGTAGDIGGWDVRRPGPQFGYDEARRKGEVLGAAVIRAYTHLQPVSPTTVGALSSTIDIPVPKLTAEEVAAARALLATPLPKNVDITLDRIDAIRKVAIAELPGSRLTAEIQVIAVGPIAFVGIPGELFVELGLEIQKQSPYPYTFIVAQPDDVMHYIPTKLAFSQGGYETANSRIAPGGGELIAQKAVELLRQLHR
jgi:neutral ceramidase